jgi:hypothetical protein
VNIILSRIHFASATMLAFEGGANITNNDELYHRVESRVPEKLLVEYVRDNRPSVGA